MNEEQRERVKLTVRGLYDAQQLRIQLQLRIARLVRDHLMTKKEADRFFKLPFSHFELAEKEMEKLVVAETRNLPIVKKWMKRIHGIGPRLSGLLVANIADVGRFDTVSKLWAYSGLHVVNGHAVKRKKNEKANWNRELKTTAWKIGKSFVTLGGPYRDLYDRYKARITEREETKGNVIYALIPIKGVGERWVPRAAVNAIKKPDEVTFASHYEGVEQRKKSPVPDWTLGHINNMAMRYIVKRFLSHLWLVWREIEDLPTREPYCKEYLGHEHIDDPWSYVTEREPKNK